MFELIFLSYPFMIANTNKPTTVIMRRTNIVHHKGFQIVWAPRLVPPPRPTSPKPEETLDNTSYRYNIKL